METKMSEPTPLRAIRLRCIDCCGGARAEVACCTAFGCPLWIYRMGKRPATVRATRPELLDLAAMRRRFLEP